MKKNIHENLVLLSFGLNIILIFYVFIGVDTIVYYLKSIPFYKTLIFLLELENRMLELEEGNILLNDKILELTKENEFLKMSKIVNIKNTQTSSFSLFQFFAFISGTATVFTCIHTIIQGYTNFTSLLNLDLSDFFFSSKEIQTINLHKNEDMVDVESTIYLKKCAEIYKSPVQVYVNSLERFSGVTEDSKIFTVCKLAQYLNEYLSDGED